MEESENHGSQTAGGTGTGTSSSGNSRWNPTKEQINMLENLYKQGIRTPTAEQIQHITVRLSAFGHIEGKNVFYWFQNHKARQRQKQKQETLAFFNRFPQPHVFPPPPGYLHPYPPPPAPNVVYGPYYVPSGQSEMGYYPQYPNVPILSNGNIKRRSSRTSEKTSSYEYGGAAAMHAPYNNIVIDDDNVIINNDGGCSGGSGGGSNQETLTLFPMHPTGILQGGTSPSTSTSEMTTSNGNVEECFNGDGDRRRRQQQQHQQQQQQQPYFDFLSGPRFVDE